MNDKFYKLPEEKQRRIINAAYKVFSQNPYKKAPMSEIAVEGGISKSLLFHYFVNKKELYVYLWTNAMEMTKKAIAEYKTLETDDFFEMLKKYRSDKIIPDEIEREIMALIDFWRKIYSQKEDEHECSTKKL